MQKEQTKDTLVNIMTFVIVVGLLFAGYTVFFKPADVSPDGEQAVSVAQIAEDAAAIGAQIKNTKRELSDLERAVASSTVVFEKPAFKNLEDFSVSVPSESVGRENPFLPAEWKIKIQALEALGVKITSATLSSSPAPSSKAPVATSSSASLLGNFGSGTI